MTGPRSNRLSVEKKTFTERQVVGGVEKSYSYQGWAVIGWMSGKRVRKQAPTRIDAEMLKNRLETEAANANGMIRPVNTRLSCASISDRSKLEREFPDIAQLLPADF